MKTSEAASVDPHIIRELKKLVAEGRGLQLEFKRKAAYPEKIIRSLIAFANTEGGTLLVGVDDDGTIPGLKYPDEEGQVICEALIKYCRPSLIYKESFIAISKKSSTAGDGKRAMISQMRLRKSGVSPFQVSSI